MPKDVNLLSSKIILFVIDGFGIGNMDDSSVQANTWQTILTHSTKNELLTLKKLMQKAQALTLDYPGADSFLGHLTMSGINVKAIKLLPLAFYQAKIIQALKAENYQVSLKDQMLVVNDSVIISDNFEAEHGLAINLTGCRDLITQQEQNKIAQIVRENVETTRVISFGARHMSIANYYRFKLQNPPFYGLDTPKTGVYNDSYDVIHLAQKINYDHSFQVQLARRGYQVYMYGKFGNIINLATLAINNYEISTQATCKNLINDLKTAASPSVFCVNFQETDLAGHSSDIAKYKSVLKIIDQNIEILITKFPEIALIITSDHGNDPQVTNGQHTREKVPFIYYGHQKININVKKLSDVAKFILTLAS